MTEATMDDVRAVLDAVLGPYLRPPSKLLVKAQRDHEQFLKELASLNNRAERPRTNG